MTVVRNPVSGTKFTVAFCALVSLVFSHRKRALAQSPSVTTNPSVTSQSGQATPSSPAITSQPQIVPPQRHTGQTKNAARNRPNTRTGNRTLELTDFQQFVAQSLRYPLSICGASLFDNAPTTFAPADPILKYYEALYGFLVRQLEAAPIDEAKNAVVVEVVDRAVEPERKSSPTRQLIIAITAALSFLLACFVVLVCEAIRRKNKTPDEAQRLATLNQYLRSSF